MSRYDLGRLQDLYLEIAKGNVDGHVRATISGNNPSTSTTEQTIWVNGGDVPLPQVTATTMTLSSDNVNDTSAGTGAQSIAISGINNDGDQIFEIIATNGTSAVTTANSYKHINLMVLSATGSSNFNEGNIYVGTGTLTAGKPAVVYNAMQPEDGASRSAFRLLPRDMYMTVVTSTNSVNANKIATTRFCVHSDAGRVCTSEIHLQDFNSTSLTPTPLVPPGSFVEGRTLLDSGSGEVDVNLGIVMIKDTYVSL